MNSKIKVLFLSAEATPFTKVGGLADVAGALPKALRALDLDVRLMIPRYGHIRSGDFKFTRVGSVPVAVGRGDENRAHVLETHMGDVPVYLIWDDQYFSNRERVYGFNDDPQRFTFFSKAVISAIKSLGWVPDLIHANDWHTAPVTAWLDLCGRKLDLYRDMATLFTVHNLAYQGVCGRLILTYAQMDKLSHLPVEPPGQVNWMAQGIARADLVSTVSATYAREILTPEMGMGLHSLLQERRDRLFGILSGIDVELWNPAQDAALTQTYDQNSLKMRAVNKTAFQREARFPASLETPLLGTVARLDEIKGLDLLLSALETLIAQREVQFVMLGTGEPTYEARFQALQDRYPQNVRIWAKFDERLARQIYGGVDAFVLPSRSEPSSLGQMTAMRYGAVPVVRSTGGLADTVVDADMQSERGNGFVFSEYTVEALVAALQRALSAYADKARWLGIQRRAMSRDFSWDASARAYVDLYQRALALHRGA